MGIKPNSPEYKFSEDHILNELKTYVDATYSQHYAGEKYQATDMIIDSGHGLGFTLGSIMKYAKRYGKKGSKEDERKDLLKICHYAIIAIHIHDEKEKENKK
jgi:hypothetical protein